MNWKMIAAGGAGLAAIVVSLINEAANKHYRSVAKEKALNDISAENLEERRKAQEKLDLADAVSKREHKEIFDTMKVWKREYGYDSLLADAHEETVVELNNFKASIDYNNRKAEIEEAFENELDAFKDSIDYDYEIDLQDGIIEDAKDAYKKRCKRIEAVSGSDDDISDALSDLKKTEKEKMDETVKEAKSRISELKQKLATEENKLNRKKQAELRVLESELQATKTRLNKTETDTCNQIKAEKDKAEEKIRADILAKRSKDEIDAIQTYDECAKFLDQEHDADDKNEWLIYENAKTHEKWAAWFKNEGVPKWLVVFAGALPLIPVGFGIKRYVTFIYQVVKAM